MLRPRPNSLPLLVTILVTILVPVLAADAAAQARFIPLGSLPGAPLEDRASAVSGDGRAVAGAGLLPTPFESEGFVWREATGVVGIGDLPGGRTASYLGALDRRGVRGAGTGIDPNTEAFLWTEGSGLLGLGDLPGGSVDSGAADISADGTVVAGSSVGALGREAFRWTAATGMVGLGDLPGGAFFSAATATNEDGSVIAGISRNAGGISAFRWTAATGMVDLGTLPGAGAPNGCLCGVDVFDMNAAGDVIVGNSDGSPGVQPFRWTPATGMVGIAPINPAGGLFYASALACDASGDVVGGVADLGSGRRAALWTQATGWFDLEAHLASLGSTGLAGWDMTYVTGLSDDGNAAVGYGYNPSGNEEGWIAYLSPPSIGDPYCGPAVANSTGAAGALLALGSGDVGRNDLALRALDLPPNAFGFFLASRAADLVPAAGGSQGTLCLGQPVGRYVGPGQILNSGAAGSFELTLDLTAMPSPTGFVAAAAGESWYFQGWYRDANPAPTSNFTEGVAVDLH